MSTEFEAEIARIRSDFERLAVEAQRREIERRIMDIGCRPMGGGIRNVATARYEKSAR